MKKTVKNTSKIKVQKSRNKSKNCFSELSSFNVELKDIEEIKFDFTSIDITPSYG